MASINRRLFLSLAFGIGIAISILSAIAIWQASPGKVRAVAGQMHKAQAAAASAGKAQDFT